MHRYLVVVCVFVYLFGEYCCKYHRDHHCKSGAVKISCSWNGTICNKIWPPTRPRPTTTSQSPGVVSIALYHGKELIGNQKVLNNTNSASFAAPFHNPDLKAFLNYTCIWMNDTVEVCQRTVVVDASLLPRQPLNLSFTVYNYHSFPSQARAINLRYNFEDNDLGNAKQTYSAIVYKYSYDVKSCPVRQHDVTSVVEKPNCQNHRGQVSCPGLLKRRITSAIYAAYAILSNSFGTCTSEMHCQRLGYYDRYGGIKNVKAENLFPIGVNISWIYPVFLMTVIHSPVTYNIKICDVSKVCRTKHQKRRRTNEIETFFVIKDGIKHDTEYSITLQYVIYEFWSPEKSPWTKDVSIVTLSKIPSKPPQLLECQKTNKVILVSWARQGCVTNYLLLLQEKGKAPVTSNIADINCSNTTCKFSYKKYDERQTDFHIELSACSNGGCTQPSSFHCYLEEPQQIQNEDTKVIGIDLIAVISIIAVVMLGALVVFFVKLVLGKCRSGSSVEVVTPRAKEDDTRSCVVDHFVYDKL